MDWDHGLRVTSRILLRLFALRKPRLNGSFLKPMEEELDSWLDFGVTPRPLRLMVLHQHRLPTPHFSQGPPLSFFTDLYSAPLLGSISLSMTLDLLRQPHSLVFEIFCEMLVQTSFSHNLPEEKPSLLYSMSSYNLVEPSPYSSQNSEGSTSKQVFEVISYLIFREMPKQLAIVVNSGPRISALRSCRISPSLPMTSAEGLPSNQALAFCLTQHSSTNPDTGQQLKNSQKWSRVLTLVLMTLNNSLRVFSCWNCWKFLGTCQKLNSENQESDMVICWVMRVYPARRRRATLGWVWRRRRSLSVLAWTTLLVLRRDAKSSACEESFLMQF